jgi:hypothetical protein
MNVSIDVSDKCPICGSPLTTVSLRRKTLSSELVVDGARYWCGASFLVHNNDQTASASCTNVMSRALEMRKELDELKRQTE